MQSSFKFTLDDLRRLIRKLDGEGLDTTLLKIVLGTLNNPKWRGKAVDVVSVMGDLMDHARTKIGEDGSEIESPFSNDPAVGVLMSAAATIQRSEHLARVDGPSPLVIEHGGTPWM